MALPADYTSGTITLTNGSPNFTGTGTGWLAADFREGDILLGIQDHAGQVYVVQEITSQTSGVLTQDWAGASGTYQYRMRYEWDSSRVSAQTRTLIELLGNGNLQALANLTGPGVPVFNGPHAMEVRPVTDFINGVAYNVQVDTLADRDAYDGQVEGFSVLVSDIGDGRSALFSKASNASGDWTDPAYITGPSTSVTVGTTTETDYGTAPTVTPSTAPGTLQLNFGFPGSPDFEMGPVTTLPSDQDASATFDPVPGGYQLNLSIPRGPTGDITGLTPFWQARVTNDIDAESARTGLGAMSVETYDPQGFKVSSFGGFIQALTVTEAATLTPSVAPAAIMTLGKDTVSDGLGGVWEFVASEPASTLVNIFSEGISLREVGTAIGNLTGGGGLTAAFDNNTSQTYNDSARNSGVIDRFIGRTVNGRRIFSAYCFGSSDQGFIQNANPSVTITLYGKVGSAPSNATDGVVLGSSTFTDREDNFSRTVLASNANMNTLFDHVWVHISGDGSNNISIAELRIFEAERTVSEIKPDYFSIELSDATTAWYQRRIGLGQDVFYARTGIDAELVDTLPINNPTPSVDTRRVIFRIPVYVQAGDLIESTGSFEVTSNESVLNVGVWSHIILTPDANGVSVSNTNWITPRNGRNCTPSMHHDTHVHAGSIIAPASGLFYVNFVAWAANTSASSLVTVERNYGHLDVRVTRGGIRPII